jgi:hypothetical protein
MALRLGGLGLTALVILGLGFVVGRASAPKGASSAAIGSAAAPASPGASRVENGVPVGYQRSQQGAIAAATNYTRFLGGPLILQPENARSAMTTLAAPESKDKLLKELEGNLAGIQNGSQIITNAARGVKVAVASYPLAYHVNNYSSTVAEVSIWSMAVLGEDGQLAPTQAWDTITVDLEWTNGDWKVTSDGTIPGPAPALTQAGPQTKQLPTQLKDYQTYSYAPAS